MGACNMFLLYIDPGTGSMLFSFFMGLAVVIYFLGRTLLIKLKFALTGKKTILAPKRWAFVIYNEGLQYWNVFEPVLDVFEERKIPLLYLSSAENDPFFEKSYGYLTGEYIGSGNKAFARLNFLEADICLMTTPGLEVYQLKRSKAVAHYAHILHDTGDATCYRLFGIDWFDSLLLSGEYQIKDIRALEKLRNTPVKKLEVVGSTYLDVFNKKMRDLQLEENHPFTVLVSPSWGQGSLLNTFGQKLLDPLINTGWRIIVRPHPQSKKSENSLLCKLEEYYKNNAAVIWDYNPENLSTLAKSDIMISDYSGIIFDYIFLFDRPVLYSNVFFNMEMYDAGELDHPPWRFESTKEFAREFTEKDLGNIRQIITDVLGDKKLTLARKRAQETAWQHIGESGKRVADFLIKTRELLISC
jgi:hypothetical protein